MKYLTTNEAVDLVNRTLSELNDEHWLKKYIQGHYNRLIKTITFIPIAEASEQLLDVGTEGFLLDWLG